MDTETWKPANYTYCDSHLKEDRRSGEDGRETRRALRSPFTFPRRVHFDVASLSFHFHADFPSKSHQKNTTGEQGQGSRGIFTPIPTLITNRPRIINYARKHIPMGFYPMGFYLYPFAIGWFSLLPCKNFESK